jgi:hypothetical protein
MKTREFSKLENEIRAEFNSAADFVPGRHWHEMVMADIRECHRSSLKCPVEDQFILPLRQLWRFATVLIVVSALICAVLYFAFPPQASANSLVDEIPLDSFDKYITNIAQL